MAAISGEEKCENFKLFLLSQARLQSDKDILTAMTYPLLQEFIRTCVVAEYEKLKAYRDAPCMEDEAARAWCRSNQAILGEASTFMLGYLEFSSADAILKVVRYLVLFVELIAIEEAAKSK